MKYIPDEVIDAAELYAWLQKAGFGLSRVECVQLITKYDRDHDNALGYVEFEGLIRHAAKLQKRKSENKN